MVLLGKALKNRSTVATDSGPARNVRLREVILAPAQYEIEKKNKEIKEEHFKKQVMSEEEIFNINKKKLLANWRKILRIAKTDELKKELEVYSQLNQRELDSLDAYLQMLDKNIEEAEDQYNLAQRNHLIQIDKLFEIRDTRIESLRAEFHRSCKILYDEFNLEAIEIRRTHASQKKELDDMAETINAEEKEKQAFSYENLQTQQEQIKQKAKEELEQMQSEMSNKQNTLSNELESLYQRYTNDTKDRFQKYLDTLRESESAQREIMMSTKKIKRNKDRIDLMDIKIKQMEAELQQKNESLKREKKLISDNFLHLKERMRKFRDEERKKLTHLVINSKVAMEKLEEMLKLGEKILKTSELCRKLETEKEKVIPFYENTVTEEDIPDELQVLYKEVSEQESKSYGYIKNYFKRFNKVMLDKIAIQQQKDLYRKENQTLKSLLKQYIDNISINDDVMMQDNPLLVAEKAQIVPVPVGRSAVSTLGKGNFVEAVEEMNRITRQHPKAN